MQDIRVRSPGQEKEWRRKRQPSSILLPGKSDGQRSLAGYSPCSHKRTGRNWTTTTTNKASVFKNMLLGPIPAKCCLKREIRSFRVTLWTICICVDIYMHKFIGMYVYILLSSSNFSWANNLYHLERLSLFFISFVHLTVLPSSPSTYIQQLCIKHLLYARSFAGGLRYIRLVEIRPQFQNLQSSWADRNINS